MLLNNQTDKQGPKCNRALTQQLDLLSPLSSSSTEPSSGGPLLGACQSLDGGSSVGPFCLFSVHFSCFSLEGRVSVDCGLFMAGDEGTSTLVVLGCWGGGWTWAQAELVCPRSDMVPGEPERNTGCGVQTCLSAAFTTDRAIAQSVSTWVMTE